MIQLARLDDSNIVKQVIVMDDGILNEDAQWSAEQNAEASCRSLYDTQDRFMLTSSTGDFRGNLASPGFTYLEEEDLFMPPKPFPSFLLNPASATWVPPVAMPDEDINWQWDEATVSWVAP
jgi:hypothetical protein